MNGRSAHYQRQMSAFTGAAGGHSRSAHEPLAASRDEERGAAALQRTTVKEIAQEARSCPTMSMAADTDQS